MSPTPIHAKKLQFPHRSKLLAFSAGLLITAISVSVWAQSFQGGPPPGGNMPAMTSEQKEIMEALRQHPELEAEFRTIVESAGGPSKAMSDPEIAKRLKALVQKDKSSTSSVANPASSKVSSNVANASGGSSTVLSQEPKDLIFDLKSIKGKDSDYVRLNGKIPTACQNKIQIDFSCDSKTNTLLFTLREASRDGFICLRDKKSDCESDGANGCKDFDKISVSDSKSFNSKLSREVLKQKAGGCEELELDSVKVGVNSQAFVAPKVDVRAKTEGTFCAACEVASQSQPLLQVKQGAFDIERSAKMASGTDSSIDPEAMKRHLEREKDRMIKKIKSAACQSAPSDDEDMDPSEMFAAGGADGPPVGGRAGGPPNGAPNVLMGGAPPSGQMAGGGDMKKMFAGNLDFMDDIQDAIDEKQEKCEKEAKKKMKLAMSQQQQSSMSGMNSMMGGNGMNSMMGGNGMNSMMGGNGMNPMMGGNGMNPMMGNYGMSGMNGMSSMMGNYGMSGMNGMSSMMGNYGMSGMSGYGRISNMYSPYLGLNSNSYTSPMFQQMMQGYGLGGMSGSYVNSMFGR